VLNLTRIPKASHPPLLKQEIERPYPSEHLLEEITTTARWQFPRPNRLRGLPDGLVLNNNPLSVLVSILEETPGWIVEKQFMFCEMWIFERLRKEHEDKCNRRRLWLARFLLVRRLESVARCPSRHSGRGDFLSLMEGAMSITPIICFLVILLFGFDLTGHVEILWGPQ
jgi:hypothetical protein